MGGALRYPRGARAATGPLRPCALGLRGLLALVRMVLAQLTLVIVGLLLVVLIQQQLLLHYRQ